MNKNQADLSLDSIHKTMQIVLNHEKFNNLHFNWNDYLGISLPHIKAYYNELWC